MDFEKTKTGEDFASTIVYQPQNKENETDRFRKFVERKYEINLDDYWKLHEWSCKNYPEFWGCVWQHFDIIHSEPYTEIFDRRRSFENMEWFKGARLNYAENVFRYKDSQVAVIEIDSNNTKYITYRELYEEVCLYAAALKDLGVKKGDVVACYMSNKAEAIFAFLATSSLGAIWGGALPLLGVKSVLCRFLQTSPKIIFASGNFLYEGKEIKLLEKLHEVVAGLQTVEKVIFIPTNVPGVVENCENIPNCITLPEFLQAARREYKKCPWELEFEQLPFDHPLCYNFTSGTTGLPKALIHSNGAFITSLRDFGLLQETTRKDVLINFSPVGWLSWNELVNTLLFGATLCISDYNPQQQSATWFWDLVDKFGITSAYIWNSIVEDMEKIGSLPNEKHRLTSLKQIFPTGSVMKPSMYDFLTRAKPGIFVDSAYGTTEAFGFISGLNSNLPVYRGEIQCFALGTDVKCLDDKGNEIVGKRGNLVIANPHPSMPITVLNDHNKEKVRDAYLKQFPGYWYVGDSVWINPVTKGFILYGRSDETLTKRDSRFSCCEISFALENFPDLLDSVCVSQSNTQVSERVILFVKLKAGKTLTNSIIKYILTTIERNLTYECVPDVIIQVPDIPYNLTGKKLNILVKKLINKMPVQNTEVVINPEAVEFFRHVELGDF